MPTQRFPLQPGAPERLTVTSGPFAFSKATIALDGTPLLTGLTPKQLEQGVSTTLPDGATLSIRKLNAGFFKADQNGLELKRDGVPIPGSMGTPEHALRTAKGAGVLLYVLAVLNGVFGAFVQFAGHDPVFRVDQGGWPYFLSALLMATLGYFVHRRLSLIALGIAMAYLVVDGFAGAVLQQMASGKPNPAGLVVRVFIAIALLGAFKVIRRHKAAPRTTSH